MSYMSIIGFILWIVLCALTAAIAEKKGRKGLGYFLISVFLSPLIGLIVVACVSDRNKIECPLCCKMIDVRASVCAYCGRDVKHASVKNKKQADNDNVEAE